LTHGGVNSLIDLLDRALTKQKSFPHIHLTNCFVPCNKRLKKPTNSPNGKPIASPTLWQQLYYLKINLIIKFTINFFTKGYVC